MSGIFPRDVVIVESSNEWGHAFDVGGVVTLTGDYNYNGFYAKGVSTLYESGGEVIEQVIRKADFTEIEAPLEAVSPTQKKAEKLVAKRVKMIYTVQDSDGDIIFFTQDRDMAREVKAEEGGKANGVIIMQYGELKEIR